MSKRTWIGGIAAAVAQVDTLTVGGTVEADDNLIMTLTDESGATQSLTVVAGSTTLSAAATAVSTAWNASTLSLFARCVAAPVGATVTVTARTAGTPFYLSVSTTDSGGAADAQTFTRANTTPSSSPNDWNSRANWVENAVPVSSDEVLIAGAQAIQFGLRQSGVTLAGFSIDSKYQGNIGGQGQPLSIVATSFYVYGGSTMYFNLNASNIPVFIAAGALVTVNGAAITTMAIAGGTVVTGVAPGDSTTIDTVNLMAGAVTVGPGVTLATYKQANGTGQLYVGATTVEAQGGTLATFGEDAITTLTNAGATVNSNSTGTITTCNANAGNTDFTKSRDARAVTTINHKKGATVALDTDIVAVTNYVPSGLVSLAAA